MIWRFQRTLSQRLLAWSLLSIAGGAAFWLSGPGYNQGLGVQAVLWGLIDGAIALFGLRGLAHKLNQPFDAALAEKDTARLRKLLWINSALDVVYSAAGITLALTLGRTDHHIVMPDSEAFNRVSAKILAFLTQFS